MGRNTTTPNPSSLDRFSIGEIQDLSGVANFYNAGTSQWLRSATYTDQSNLSASSKAALAASATSSGTATVSLATANDLGVVNSMPIARELFMEARIASVNTTVLQRTPSGDNNGYITVINSSGATNLTPLVGTYQGGAIGANFALLSNGTKFFIYYYTSSSALACKTSTDGITWTTETLSGLSFTIALSSGNSQNWDNTTVNTASPPAGYYYGTDRPDNFGGCTASLWCGARVLVLTRLSNTYYGASLSTDGLTFGGDNTNSVLGTTTLGNNLHMNFYRNGNNCFLAIGTTFRKSTDGGVTWSAATFAAAPNASTHYNIPNLTDPTRRLITGGDGTSSGYFTTDSGGTWSAARTLPQPSRWGLVYRGSTVISSYTGGCFRSVDDGVTWESIIFPAGTNSSAGQIVADENRFYFVPNGGGAQLLTSTDGITWTIRTTPGTVTGTGGVACHQVSSDIVYLTLGNMQSGIFTLNGGVTWNFASTSTSSSVSANINGYVTKRTTDGPNNGYLVFGQGNRGDPAYSFFLSSAALSAGGGFYRTGSSTIAPSRTNALAYIRVG